MIQSFPLGTSVTKIDGGNIATGTILGDRIKAGDITADRLNAASIQGSSLLITSVINGINNGTAGSTRINGGYIETGTIAANKLIIQGGYSGCLNIDPQFQDSSVWTYSDAGSASIVTISDAPVGNKVLRSNPTFHGGDKTFYPIDINKTYRVRFWARGVGHNGFLYMCLRQYKTPSDAGLCDTNGGRSPYKPCGVSIGAGWAEYDFTWGPADFQSGVKFVRLDWLLNYGGNAGYMEICNPRFEEAITGSLIVQGSITTDHIAAAGISADVLKAGTIDVNRLNVSGIINVVNGGGTTKITGTGIATESITTSHITTAGLSADVIKTGSITSAGSGGVYQSYNYSNNTAVGFKLAHVPFTATNKWGRSQSIQAEFGNTVLVKGYPLGPALGIPLSALDFPPLDQAGAQSRVFYRGNNDPGGVPNIDCLDIKDLGVSMYDHNYFSAVMQWRLQPTKPSDNLDGMRMMRIKVYPHAGGSIAYDTVYVPMCDRLYATVPLNVTASGSGSVLTVTAMPAGNITASCYGTTLTVTAVSGVSLAVGMYIVGAGFSSDTQIAALGTGTGGAGTYMVTTSQTVGSGSFLATLTPIAVGMGVVGPNIPANTTIVSLETGTGGTGTYNLSQGVSSSFSATSITITTDNSPFNAAWGQASFGHRMSSAGSGVLYYGDPPYPFYGHLLVSISNAYGWSAERWFHPISTTAVDLWFTRNTTPPYGAPPIGGGTGGTGGGGGGGCTPAGTPFLTPGGVIPVEQLKAGDFAVAYDEHTLVPHYSRVNRVYEYEARQLYRIITDRGELVCSHDHRLALVAGINLVEYPPARDLSYGDLLLHRKDDGSVENAMVLSVQPLDRYEKVYHCTLDSGHVYVAGDFLAHNIYKLDLLSRD